MKERITREQKELALEAIREEGTMKAAARAAGISIRSLNNEMKRSIIFRKRVTEAIADGNSGLVDTARQLVIDYMNGKYEKTDRNRLTAAIALLNAYEPGFKTATAAPIRNKLPLRIITGVPRPQYNEPPEYEANKEKLKQLNAGQIETRGNK